MNTNQKAVITLIKSALTQQPQQLPEDFTLQQILPLVKMHHIAPMAYEGAVICGIDPQGPIMAELFRGYCRALQVSERQMRDLGRVLAAFQTNGIDHMPLKGCKMKALYPKPELRLMGDADVLIRLEQYDRILPIMQQLGFVAHHESDHELVWRTDGLYLELHKRLIPSYNKDFHAYFGAGWQLAKPEEGTRYSMSANDEMVFLFTHFAKHYRDGGIGCRHVADLWVYCNAHPELDEAYIEEKLSPLHLLEFYRHIRRLMAVWFEDTAGDERMDFITDFIFDSGSWGNKASRLQSRTVRDSKHNVLRFSSKLVYLWKTAFPSCVVLREKYTILKRCPWMLPLVWLWRPVYKVLFERHSLQVQKQNVQVLSKENVQTRQQALQYVGLDYNF